MARISVEVVYATRSNQEIVRVELEDGACATDALLASGLPVRYPEISRTETRLGIFGNQVRRATRLRDGDRVEVYRPLNVDPKAARREKASAKRRAIAVQRREGRYVLGRRKSTCMRV